MIERHTETDRVRETHTETRERVTERQTGRKTGKYSREGLWLCVWGFGPGFMRLI